MAHGYYTEEHVHDAARWMQQQLQATARHIDAFEHSPFHPEGVVETYARESELRKPQAGMLHKLQREWTVEPSGSFMVGDRESTSRRRRAGGVPGHVFAAGNLLEFVKRIVASPARRRSLDSIMNTEPTSVLSPSDGTMDTRRAMSSGSDARPYAWPTSSSWLASIPRL